MIFSCVGNDLELPGVYYLAAMQSTTSADTCTIFLAGTTAENYFPGFRAVGKVTVRLLEE